MMLGKEIKMTRYKLESVVSNPYIVILEGSPRILDIQSRKDLIGFRYQ